VSFPEAASSPSILLAESGTAVPTNGPEILKMMDLIPIVFVTFKVLVFGTGMFFAIKWHYDQGKKEEPAIKMQKTTRFGALWAAVVLLSVLGLIYVVFAFTT